jgi:hypothetical protein
MFTNESVIRIHSPPRSVRSTGASCTASPWPFAASVASSAACRALALTVTSVPSNTLTPSSAFTQAHAALWKARFTAIASEGSSGHCDMAAIDWRVAAKAPMTPAAPASCRNLISRWSAP